MTKINDGGPAFPQPDLSGYGMGPRVGADGCYQMAGMTIRDWFAGQALTGLIPAYQSAYGSPTADCMELVREAYGYADLMLAAREADPS